MPISRISKPVTLESYCFVTQPAVLALEAMNHLVHMGNSFTQSEEHSVKVFEGIKCFFVHMEVKPRNTIDFNTIQEKDDT